MNGIKGQYMEPHVCIDLSGIRPKEDVELLQEVSKRDCRQKESFKRDIYPTIKYDTFFSNGRFNVIPSELLSLKSDLQNIKLSSNRAHQREDLISPGTGVLLYACSPIKN